MKRVRTFLVAQVGPDGHRLGNTECVELCGLCSVERSSIPA